MRSFKIHATTPATASYNDFTWNSHFFADSLLYVEMYTGAQASIVLTDVSNAMKPGKTCQQVKFSGVWNSNECEVANLLLRCGGDFRKLFALLAAIPAVKYNAGTDVVLHGVAGRAYNSLEPSNRTYSPFAMLNRLPAEPAKWTLAHVVRALVNGQFSGLSCHGVYSDDYAWDNATNYSKGGISPDGLIQELVDSKSGWWVSAKEGYITIGCYGYKSYGFTLDLRGQAKPLQFEAPDAEEIEAIAALEVVEEVPAAEAVLADALTQAVATFCQEHADVTCERHACGNMLLSQPIDRATSAIWELCAALNNDKAKCEIGPEADFMYLAIYPTKAATAAAEPIAPEGMPLAALAAVMQISHLASEATTEREYGPQLRPTEQAKREAEATGYAIAGLYQLAYRAHSNTSFSPERRAATYTKEYQAALAADRAKIQAAGDTAQASPERIAEALERYTTGYISKLNAWLSAKSRCISSMITGGSNFPVRRAQKANDSEHNRMGEFIDYYENNVRRAIRSLKPAVINPARVGALPEQPRPFELNGQGGEVLVNLEVDRVQLVFESKPDADTISQLKSNGFRWSPRFSAWQRQDTENGRWAVRRLTGVDMSQPVQPEPTGMFAPELSPC